MKTLMILGYLVVTWAAMNLVPQAPPSLGAVTDTDDGTGWKLYTNARFGFSVRYPDDWSLGNPLPDGIGVTLYPSIEHSLVALSGHMNVVSGSSRDGRQTLDEFALAHRRIITDLYDKKKTPISWRADQGRSFAGLPGKHLTFTYKDDKLGEMIEHHILSVGRNEGRGIRVKVPRAMEDKLMPIIERMVAGYQPGRDQNAVSPLKPKPEAPGAPR